MIEAPDAEKHPSNSRIHHVDGYSDTENMWEKVWSLERQEAPQFKNLNHRSEFLFNVNENKQFKVKRNALYKKVVKEL
jgi:hypothetical protein